MKTKLLMIFSLFCMLLILVAVPSCAEETANDTAEAVLTYSGVSARTNGNGHGIRSLWQVDKTKIASLEESGYTVTVGAIMGISEANGNVYNATSDSLTVTVKDYVGVVTDQSAAAAVVVYASGEQGYATNLWVKETDTRASFAYTTTYSGATAQQTYFEMTLVYRGFVILTKDGTSEVFYVDAVPETAPIDEQISLYALSSYFMNDYAGADADLYKSAPKIREVVATCKADVHTLASATVANDSMLLEDAEGNKSVLFGGGSSKDVTLTVDAPFAGFYRIDGLVAYNDGYVDYLYCKNETTGTLTSSRLGASSNKANNSTADAITADLAKTETPIAYSYLAAGTNTLSFYVSSSYYVAVSDVSLYLESIIDTENGDLVKNAHGYSEIKVDNTATDNYGKADYGNSGILLRGDSTGQNYAVYTVSPTVSGDYMLSLLSASATASVSITVADESGVEQSDTLAGSSATTTLGSSSSSPIVMKAAKLFTLKAGKTYTVTLQNTGKSWFYLQKLAFCLKNAADEETEDNEESYEILFKDMETIPSAATLLDDGKTYYVNGQNAAFGYTLSVPTAGVYGIRMKYVNTVDDVTYRVQFYTTSTQNTERTRARIAGGTTAYSGDANAFVLPVAERKTAYTETVGYQYLSQGANETTLYFESGNTKGVGLYGIEYYLVSSGESVRMTAADSEVDIVNGTSTFSRGYNKTDKNLFMRGGDTGTWQAPITVEKSGAYFVHSLVAQDKGTMTYTFTNTETGDAYTSTYTGAADMGGSSTAIAAVSLSSVLLPAGDYTFSISTTGGWINFADVRLILDPSVVYMAAGATSDVTEITPEKDGYYEVTSSMDGTASVGLLLYGVEVATSAASGSANVEARSLTKLFLRAGTTYAFSLKNYADVACAASAPTVTFVSDRTLQNGYFVDIDGDSLDTVKIETRLELSKNNVSEGVSFVDSTGTSVTIGTTNTSETVPYSHTGGIKPTNATEFGYLADTTYTGIKMKDGTGSAPLGIRFTVETAGTYDISVIYSTASAGEKAKLAAGMDSVPDGSSYTVLIGESGRTAIHKISLGSYELTAGEHTLYLYNCGSFTFWLHAADLSYTTTDTDITFTPEYAGDYRVTAYLTSGDAVSFNIDAVMKGNEQALFTGDYFSADIAASENETAVFVSKNYTFMTDIAYTVRLSVPAERVASVSFDLVSKVEEQLIYLPESNYVGTVTSKNTYTDTNYAGFSEYTSTAPNYADFGYASNRFTTWRTQDKNSGNKLQYDPMGIKFTVPESGYYEFSLVYITGGTATLAAYVDGSLTNGYWSEGPTVNEETSRLEGTWVPYVYDVGSNGIILTENTGVENTGGSLAEVALGESVYLTAGEHILYLANVGTYSLYMAAARIAPVSAASDYKSFESMCAVEYDESTATATATVSASGRNSYGYPGYTIVYTVYDKNGNEIGKTSCESTSFVTKNAVLTVENVANYHHSVISFTDVSGAKLTLDYESYPEDYRVVFLSDTHLYDWENMFFDSSAQRTAWAVESALIEHAISPIDAVIIPGDVVNNYLYEYEAGTFEAWEYVDSQGVTHTSVYKGVSYPAGSSGTENDPLGVLRILSFVELVQPLADAGIPVYYVHGNHDCYRDSIFEMALKLNHSEGYLGGALQYETDDSGNLLVPDYRIVDGAIELYTKTVLTTDADYDIYAKGYGKDYAFALNDTTAFMVFDNYYNRSEDPTDSGFISNASGRSWGEAVVTEETVNTLVALTKDYTNVYITLHSMTSNQTYVKAAMTNANVTAVFDGHTHQERALPNAFSTGKYVFTCGYFGVPLMSDQPNFQNMPFSYRVLDKNGGTLRSYIVLPERDYPEYTFKGSSGAYISAFYQEYFRRTANIISTDQE